MTAPPSCIVRAARRASAAAAPPNISIRWWPRRWWRRAIAGWCRWIVVPQDGHDKQDCESMAARRWLVAHGASYARLDPVYLGDDLYSRQPICQAVRAAGGHFLFVCKPSSHPTIEEYLTGVELAQLTKRVKHGRQRFTHTYRWLCEVPLRDGADAMTVNWLMIEIRNAAGEVTYHY